ncbi:putative aminopeptidase W07G4.4, partial [Ctenocephalides felis]|uniref:putative aminopeptidase W07G4.4 n=1 Tax=Ctenocephalides felis TaxID=7515 RepID=UPI000E6E58D8
ERMCASRIEEYVKQIFKNSIINITVIKEEQQLLKEYPLLHAVNRAASTVEPKSARVIYLEYKPDEEPQRTIFLVGKGVTYDTGGADVKVGSAMIGMSRDKSGAAVVAGFMHLCNLIRPKKLRVVGAMACVRNSVGPEMYVADEIITSRSGMNVRIINTDAEGRMAMADVLTKCREEAETSPDPHLYTIATLTGHAQLTVGLGYSIVIDNSVAAYHDHAQKLQLAGEAVGQPFEISKLRREDFAVAVSSVGKGENLIQCLAGASSRQMRGHQYPVAFLTLVSGLDKHGLTSEKPISYSHLDITPSVLWPPEVTTGSPVVALAHLHLILEQSQMSC